jgi:hypothetical protein
MVVANPISPLKESTHATFTSVEDILRNTDWDDITCRLVAYANWRASFYGKASGAYRSRAEDYAQEAIKLFVEGRRHYEPSPAVSFFRFLCGVVESLMSHDAEKTSRRPRTIRIATAADNESASNYFDAAYLRSPEDVERRIISGDELEHLLDWLEPDLRAYAQVRMEFEGTAAEYARALNTSEREIRNMDKRLKRRRNEWQKC